MAAEVSVLVPSAGGGSSLLALVEAVLGGPGPDAEVLVADNGLEAEVRSRLRSAGAEVVEIGHNAGFGDAVNRVAARAEGSVLLVTNDDVEPLPGFIAALAEPVVAGAEMAAGILLMAERPARIDSAGVVIDRLLGPHDHLHGLALEALGQSDAAPLGPCGAAAAFAGDAFRAAGGFDAGLFAYAEEVDLALRLRRLGARCELAPNARALHATSDTLGYGSLAKAIVVGRSRGYLMRKYGVLSRPGRAVAALAVEGAAGAALAVRHRSPAPLASRVRGWRECRAREPFPPREWATVGVPAGLRARLSRQRRTFPP